MGLRESKFLDGIMERNSNYAVAERMYKAWNIPWLCSSAVQ